RVPSQGQAVDDDGWTAGGIKFWWRPVLLQPLAGEVVPDGTSGANGWLFTASAGDGQQDRVPAVPTRCPNCGDSWETPRRDGIPLEVTSPDRMRSPLVRGRVAPNRLAQVLAETLLRDVYPDATEQRLVLFSDSRQDAARLNAELDTQHYRDAVRQL